MVYILNAGKKVGTSDTEPVQWEVRVLDQVDYPQGLQVDLAPKEIPNEVLQKFLDGASIDSVEDNRASPNVNKRKVEENAVVSSSKRKGSI